MAKKGLGALTAKELAETELNTEHAYRNESEVASLISTLNDQETAWVRKHQFQEQAQKALLLYLRKNDEYLDAVRQGGVLGAAVEFLGIGARLRALVIRNPQHGRDQAKDLRNVLTDALVYAAIALIMFDEQNFDGEE